MLLKVISSDLNSDEEENHRADPYSERQELRKSIVLVSGSQQEKVCSMQLALRIRSFLMEAMSYLFDLHEAFQLENTGK